MLLLSAWVNSAQAYPRVCSSLQLEQLAANVRMQHVSSVYLHSVLPDLPWIRDNCGGKIKLLRLLQLQRTSRGLVDKPHLWSGPAAWISDQRKGTTRSVSSRGLPSRHECAAGFLTAVHTAMVCSSS